MMSVNLEAGTFEPSDRRVEQAHVLEHTTAQGHMAKATPFVNALACPTNDVGQRRVEASRDD